jgi:hypothetical protein
MRGNAADIRFADDSTLLWEPATYDNHLKRGSGFLSVLSSTF